jgi:TPR repeat protein
VILAASGREIAFASLLPSSHAGYLLIRGLPATAKLSAGRQSESGTWLVKGDYVHNLTLTMGAAAPGDYPVEVYVLQSGDAPQARRSLVFRIEAPTFTYATYAPDMSWASALLDVMPAAHAAEEPAVPAEVKVLHDRAQRLLKEGDIAAARLLLLHLAERGEGDAAYDLARTFDRDMLTELGAKGMDGDLARARGWYERASQDGNTKAAERLKVLASLSGTGPSD